MGIENLAGKSRAIRNRELRAIAGKYGKMHLKMWMEMVVGNYNDVKEDISQLVSSTVNRIMLA